MADIFDQVLSERNQGAGDVFDQVAAQRKAAKPSLWSRITGKASQPYQPPGAKPKVFGSRSESERMADEGEIPGLPGKRGETPWATEYPEWTARNAPGALPALKMVPSHVPSTGMAMAPGHEVRPSNVPVGGMSYTKFMDFSTPSTLPDLPNDATTWKGAAKETFKMLHTPTDKPKTITEFVTNTLPLSAGKTAYGALTFPYELVKSFEKPWTDTTEGIDNAIKAGISGTKEERDKALAQVKTGVKGYLDAMSANVQGFADFLSQGTGLKPDPYGFMNLSFDWPKFKEAWTTDPAGSALSIAAIVDPLFRKKVGELREATEAPAPAVTPTGEALGPRPYMPTSPVPRSEIPPDLMKAIMEKRNQGAFYAQRMEGGEPVPVRQTTTPIVAREFAPVERGPAEHVTLREPPVTKYPWQTPQIGTDVFDVVARERKAAAPEIPPAAPPSGEPTIEKAREPWQMTRQEYRDRMIQYRPALVTDDGEIIPGKPGETHMDIMNRWGKTEGLVGTGWVDKAGNFREQADIVKETGAGFKTLQNIKDVDRTHKEVLQKALSEGKPVPVEVLKDYPDLAKPKRPSALARRYGATSLEPLGDYAKPPTEKEAKLKSFQTYVREYGGVDPQKWVASGYALEDLPLGMRKKGGLGPDEFTEMYGTVIPDLPEGMDSRDHFAKAVRDFQRRLPVTLDQHEREGYSEYRQAIRERYGRRPTDEDAAELRGIQEETDRLAGEIVDKLSDEEVARLAGDPEFVSEDEYLANPSKYLEEKATATREAPGELPGTPQDFTLSGNQPIKQRTFEPPEIRGERLPGTEVPKATTDEIYERKRKQGLLGSQSGAITIPQTIPETATAVGKLAQNMFYPEYGASKESATALYGYKGQVARELATAEARLSQLGRRLSGMSENDFIGYIDKIRSGRAGELTGDLKEFNEVVNVLSNALWDKVVELYPEMEAHRIENHALMTLRWITDPEARIEEPGRLFDARNLEGTKQFLKRRSGLTASEIIAQGKGLKSHNPVRILFHTLNDVAKYVYSGHLVRDAIDQDRWKYLPKGEPIPEGYALLNDKIATVHKRLLFPEELEGKEYVDRAVYDGLMKVADNLGLSPERRPKIGGTRLGYASPTGETVTKSATDLGVLSHEIGHQIDFRWKLWDRIVREVEGIGKRGEVTKTASAKQRGVLQRELRALADITGGPKYKTHNKFEKIAQMVEGYVHAPDVMKEVAPNVYDAFDGFVREHREIAGLAKIRQGLQYQELKYGIKVPQSVYVKSWNVLDEQGKVINRFPQKEQAQVWADENGGTLKPQVGFPVSAEAGRWVLPSSEARMLNNFLSKDMIRGNTLGEFAVNAKGWYTGIELISGFHYATIAQEGLSTRLSLGLQQALRGDVQGLARNIRSPQSSLWLGHMAREYMKDPEGWLADPKNHAAMTGYFGKDAPKMEELVDSYFKGGGLTTQDPALRWGRDRMPAGLDIFREGKAEGDPAKIVVGGMKVPYDVAKFITRDLLFEKIIPQVKFSNFALQYAYDLKQYAHQIERGQLTRGEIARRTVASIENRFGEMNWSNFWLDKSWKTALQIFFRSYTWQAGTWRGFSTAIWRIPEQIKFAAQAVSRGERPPVDQDVTWVVGLVAAHVAEAALIGYGAAAITGKPELKPQGWFDYIFPKISLLTRVSIPGYVKEPISLVESIKKDPWHIPWSYIQSKMSGFIGKFAELRKNKDFYGNAIYDPDAPVYEQLADMAKHLTAKPFSLTSYQAERAQGGGTGQAIMGGFGFQKAPWWVGKSQAETMMADMHRRMEQGRSKEQAAYYSLKRETLAHLREQGESWRTLPADLKQKLLKLPDSKLDEIDKEAEMTPLQVSFKYLDAKQAIKVWKVATPEQRKELEEIYDQKLGNYAEKLTDEDYEDFKKVVAGAEKR